MFFFFYYAIEERFWVPPKNLSVNSSQYIYIYIIVISVKNILKF